MSDQQEQTSKTGTSRNKRVVIACSAFVFDGGVSYGGRAALQAVLQVTVWRTTQRVEQIRTRSSIAPSSPLRRQCAAGSALENSRRSSRSRSPHRRGPYPKRHTAENHIRSRNTYGQATFNVNPAESAGAFFKQDQFFLFHLYDTEARASIDEHARFCLWVYLRRPSKRPDAKKSTTITPAYTFFPHATEKHRSCDGGAVCKDNTHFVEHQRAGFITVAGPMTMGERDMLDAHQKKPRTYHSNDPRPLAADRSPSARWHGARRIGWDGRGLQGRRVASSACRTPTRSMFLVVPGLIGSTPCLAGLGKATIKECPLRQPHPCGGPASALRHDHVHIARSDVFSWPGPGPSFDAAVPRRGPAGARAAFTRSVAAGRIEVHVSTDLRRLQLTIISAPVGTHGTWAHHAVQRRPARVDQWLGP